MDGYYEDYDSGLDHDDPGENLYPSNSQTPKMSAQISHAVLTAIAPILATGVQSTNGKRLTLW
jgi:hypothetical protein